MPALTFTVSGRPVTQGSKTALTRGGRPWLVDRNDMATKTMPADRLKDWREKVAEQAAYAMHVGGWELEQEHRLTLVCRFVLERPDSHWLKSGKLRKGAAKHPPGDLDKYCRAIGDALTGVAYRDDTMIAELIAHKEFARQDEDGHVFVSVGVV